MDLESDSIYSCPCNYMEKEDWLLMDFFIIIFIIITIIITTVILKSKNTMRLIGERAIISSQFTVIILLAFPC